MKKIITVFSLLVIALSSCNFPIAQQDTGLTLEQQAATVVAQTLTAITAENPVPLASPTLGATEQPLASPTVSGAAPTLQPNVTPTVTAGTPGATILTVDSNTNCREGPGPTYVIVIVLVPGTNYQMIARAADNKYWVVTEIGKSNACWVPADMSNAFGNVNLLPVTTPSAPTSAASALQAPGALAYQYDCAFNGIPGNIHVYLKWADRSSDESGFRVYRDGSIIATLGANTIVYVDDFAGSISVIYTYFVSAFNASGEAMSTPISFSCQ
jgi:hypothetical protein